MPVHDWTCAEAEEPGLFHSFHVTWLVEIAGRLNQLLPTPYYALPEKKAVGFEPDVIALDFGGDGSPEPAGSSEPGGGLSLTLSPPKVEIDLRRAAGGPARVIAVRRASNDRLVAIIEVISPGNKSSGHAIRAFVAKAIEFLERGVHVHVIDLFPPTPRDPRGIHDAIWNAYSNSGSTPPAKPLTIAAYKAGADERAFVQSVDVGEPLPDMPLILESDLYVSVPLEETYMAAFAKFPRRWRNFLTAVPA